MSANHEDQRSRLTEGGEGGVEMGEDEPAEGQNEGDGVERGLGNAKDDIESVAARWWVLQRHGVYVGGMMSRWMCLTPVSCGLEWLKVVIREWGTRGG